MADRYFITGDIVGADAPNYGENRVEIGASPSLTVDMERSASVITLKEKSKVIYDTIASGNVVYAKMVNGLDTDICVCIHAFKGSSSYSFIVFVGENMATFTATSDNDFPTMEISG